MIANKKSNRADNIDVLKAICAFLIVCIHIPFPGTIGDYFTVLTRIAVPIFFMITGYFYIDTVKRGRELYQIKKIFILVVSANLIWLLWDAFCAAIRSGMGSFFNRFTVKNLLKFLILNESPFSGHLWYLGAILYVLIIVLIADRLHCRKIIYFLIPLLLIGDLAFGKYSIVIWGQEFLYIIVRNFLFVGLPYFCIGQIIRNGKIFRRIREIRKSYLCLIICIFAATSLMERFILVCTGMNAIRDHYISTTFLAVAVFMFFLKGNESDNIIASDRQNENKVMRVLRIIGRRYSTWLYILHPMFITCFGFWAEKTGVYSIYRIIAPFMVYVGTLIFLVLVEQVKKLFIRKRLCNKRGL